MQKMEIFHKGNTQTVLTVTPTRITIKFKDGLDKDQEERIQSFFLKVADRLKDNPHTSRGTLQDENGFRIRLRSAEGATVFRETDF